MFEQLRVRHPGGEKQVQVSAKNWHEVARMALETAGLMGSQVIMVLTGLIAFAFYNLGKLRALPDHLHPKEEPLATANEFSR